MKMISMVLLCVWIDLVSCTVRIQTQHWPSIGHSQLDPTTAALEVSEEFYVKS